MGTSAVANKAIPVSFSRLMVKVEESLLILLLTKHSYSPEVS